MNVRKDIDSQREYIEKALKSGTPRLEICRILKCKYDTLLRRIKRWNLIQYKNQSRKGISHKEAIKPVLFYLNNQVYITSSRLKEKLYNEGIKQNECEICGINKWLKKDIQLELDHINGDKFDNRIENLRILCPNCHSQTLNFRGRNIGRYAASMPIGEQIDLKSIENESLITGSTPVLPTKLKKCEVCNKKISRNAISRCKRCVEKKKKIRWPSVYEVKKMVEYTSYLATGRKLGVSDNAVRKFLKKYDVVV